MYVSNSVGVNGTLIMCQAILIQFRTAAHRRRYMYWMAVVALEAVLCTGAHAQDYRAADGQCSSALEQSDKHAAINSAHKCRDTLEQLKRGLGPTAASAAVGISVRLSIVDAVQRAREADEQKDRISLLRLYPRLL